jgi:hypothetical protein
MPREDNSGPFFSDFFLKPTSAPADNRAFQSQANAEVTRV